MLKLKCSICGKEKRVYPNRQRNFRCCGCYQPVPQVKANSIPMAKEVVEKPKGVVQLEDIKSNANTSGSNDLQDSNTDSGKDVIVKDVREDIPPSIEDRKENEEATEEIIYSCGQCKSDVTKEMLDCKQCGAMLVW